MGSDAVEELSKGREIRSEREIRRMAYLLTTTVAKLQPRHPDEPLSSREGFWLSKFQA